ncbi:MAG: hypothetical protein DI587_25410 [Variovorax paradoxus]|nr:MAG: hypothetical protein DI583_25410 [Variovorax paradoxus]PZQ05318.1 MAG: hypothetical protein DI587_25410 [Variovorax paradoxus]
MTRRRTDKTTRRKPHASSALHTPLIAPRPDTAAVCGTDVPENKAGAGSNIGADADAGTKTTPDGYTPTMGTSATHAQNPFPHTAMTFDAAVDFEPLLLTRVLPTGTNPSFRPPACCPPALRSPRTTSLSERPCYTGGVDGVGDDGFGGRSPLGLGLAGNGRQRQPRR